MFLKLCSGFPGAIKWIAPILVLCLLSTSVKAQREARIHLDLVGEWKYAAAADTESGPWVKINLPGQFDRIGEFSIRKRFGVPKGEAAARTWVITVPNIGGEASLAVNGLLVARDVGGHIPGRYLVPPGMIHDGQNKIEILLRKERDNSSIPTRALALAPADPVGLLAPITIDGVPGAAISALRSFITSGGAEVTYVLRNNSGTAARVEGVAEVIDNRSGLAVQTFAISEQLSSRQELEKVVAVSSLAQWSTESPGTYTFRIRLEKNDSLGSQLNDEMTSAIGNRTIQTSTDGRILLNSSSFQFKGSAVVAVVDPATLLRSLVQLKRMGGNSVRFISVPSEHALNLCDSLGIAALVEVPITNSPATVVAGDDISTRSKLLIERLLAAYGGHPSFIAVGLGEGNEDNSERTQTFYSKMASVVRGFDKGSHLRFFISRYPQNQFALDFAALSVFGLDDSREATEGIQKFAEYWKGKKPFVIAGAGTLATIGDHSGFANTTSEEGQAKFLTDEFRAAPSASGFFGGSLTDYRGGSANSLAGNTDHYLVTSGLLDSNGRPRQSYEQLSQLFHAEPNLVSLKAGEARSESPLSFLLYGFALILLFFLLMNVDKRFREYINRALFRPFNFFADIRDQRLIPNVDTTLLAVILSGSLALFFGSLLHSFREGYFANWLLSSILADGTHAWLSKMAWQYISMVLWFTIIFFGLMIMLTLILRFAAIFIRGRIFLNDTYNVTIWALLPLIFLLPYDLILPRLDRNSVTATVAIVIFAILMLWTIYRLLKATGVLFDVYPTKLYLYGSLAIVAFLSIAALYLEHHSNIFENYSFVRSVISATELTP